MIYSKTRVNNRFTWQYALVAYLLGFLLLALLSISPKQSVNFYLSCWFLLASAYFLLISKLTEINFRYLCPLVFIILIFKFCAIFLPVIFTSDWPRYIFEGRLLASGVNPLLNSPNDFLYFPSQEIWNQIEYKSLSAIYPPVSIIFFAVFAKSLLSWKLFVFFLEIINLLIIIKILDYKRVDRRFSLIYFASPLVIIELGLSGHLDVLAIFFCLLAYYLYLVRPKAYGFTLGFVLGLAFLVKYTPIIFAGILITDMLKKRNYQQSVAVILVFMATAITLLMFFGGEGSASSLTAYLKHWRFNDSLLHLLGAMFQVDWQDLGTFVGIKYFLLGMLSLGLLLIALSNYTVVQKVIAAYLLFYLCSAVVHPWYVTWIIPFLAIGALPAHCQKLIVLFSLTVLLSYQARVLGVNYVFIPLKFIEYSPIMILVIYGLRLKLPFCKKYKVCS